MEELKESPKLFIYPKKGDSFCYSLKKEKISIGRSPEDDIILNDPFCNRQHCFISYADKRYIVRDNNSKNGTFINGKKITSETALKKGDEILVGSTIICFDKEILQNVEITDSPSRSQYVESILNLEKIELEQKSSYPISEQRESLPHIPPDKSLDRIMDLISEKLPMDRGIILIKEGNPPQLIPKVVRVNNKRLMNQKIELSQSIINMAIEKNSSFLTRDAQADRRFRAKESIISSPHKSAMFVPLKEGKEIIGIIYLDRISLLEQFSDEDLKKLSQLSNLAADKIEDAKKEKQKLSYYPDGVSVSRGMPSYERGIPEVPKGVVDRVHFSVTSPPIVCPGNPFIIDIWAHLREQREAVIQLAKCALENSKIHIKSKGPFVIERGAILSVRLEMEGLIVEDPEDTILWDGDVGNATFLVVVPENAEEGARSGKAMIYANGLRIAKLNFLLHVGALSSKSDGISTKEELYQRAFASYASEDRDEVLSRIQGLIKGMPNLDVFFDVASLRSGDKWKERLGEEIKSRDVFYLFWSEAASHSKWVDWEWRYAYQERGIDFIDPFPIVSPEEVPPPKELANELHFNDWTLAYRRRKAIRQD